MEATTPQPGAAPEEVLFLVVQALCQGPFAQLGEAVAREAAAQGLLPRRHDVHGAPQLPPPPAASAAPAGRCGLPNNLRQAPTAAALRWLLQFALKQTTMQACLPAASHPATAAAVAIPVLHFLQAASTP